MSGLTTTSRSKTKPTPGDILLMTNVTKEDLSKPNLAEDMSPRTLDMMEKVLKHYQQTEQQNKPK